MKSTLPIARSAPTSALADPTVDQPSSLSGVEWAENGKAYVVLTGGRNDNGICAVYRVKTDGRLKRLQRWPASLPS